MERVLEIRFSVGRSGDWGCFGILQNQAAKESQSKIVSPILRIPRTPARSGSGRALLVESDKHR
jgi:hypothetical protein